MIVCIRYFFISSDLLKNILKFEVVSFDDAKYIVVSHYKDYYVLVLINKIDVENNILYFEFGKYRLLDMSSCKEIEYMSFKAKQPIYDTV